MAPAPVRAHALKRTATLLLLLALVPTAHAHGAIEDSRPRSAERLASAPLDVWIEFNEPVDARSTNIRVYDPNLTRVDNDDTRLQSRTRARVTLHEGLAEAGYLVQWDTISLVDGHPTRGSFGFSIGNATPPETGPDRPPPLPVLSVLGKTAAYAGLALACGAAATRILLRRSPPGLSRQLQLGAALHIGGLLVYWLDSASLSDQPAWAYLTGTGFGRSLGLRLTLGLLLAGLAWLPHRVDRTLRGPAPAALCLPLVALYANTGHAATQNPPLLGILLDALHLGAALTWAGGLVSLYLCLRDPDATPADSADTTRRFSRIAIACALTVVATGTLLTIRLLDLGQLHRHLATGYGLTLLYKLLLASAMLLLGATNHFSHSRRLQQEPAPDRARLLRLNVRREALSGLIVLLLAATLTNLSPALPEPTPEPPPLQLQADGATYRFALIIEPPPSSREASLFTVHLRRLPDLIPDPSAYRVRLTFTPPDPDLDPAFLDLRSQGEGTYRHTGAVFPIPGTWRLTLSVQSPSTSHDEAQFTLPVA